jgi:hypothetical protein
MLRSPGVSDEVLPCTDGTEDAASLVAKRGQMRNLGCVAGTAPEVSDVHSSLFSTVDGGERGYANSHASAPAAGDGIRRLADSAAHTQRAEKKFQARVVLMLRYVFFSAVSFSNGNMHSIRNSCAVMHCGVPTVVMSEK